MRIENAQIESTMLGIEGHGIFTFNIQLDYGGSSQGFGGYFLDQPEFGIKFLKKIFEVLEIETWEELKGQYCRAKIEDGLIIAIGHLLKDKWIEPKEFYNREHKVKEN